MNLKYTNVEMYMRFLITTLSVEEKKGNNLNVHLQRIAKN